MAESAQVKKAVGEAAEMVKQLPEALQAVAFGKAFDALIGATSPPSSVPGATQAQGRRRKAASANGRRLASRSNSTSGSSSVDAVVGKLNRTEHPLISGERKALDNALLVLEAARDKCGVDCLTAGDISAILRKKFGLSIDTPAIRMALHAARKLVDKTEIPTGYAYRLMQPGEIHLKALATRPAKDK